MTAIILPVYSREGVKPKLVDTDSFAFCRSIMGQGKGARKAWRTAFSLGRKPVAQSEAAREWNAKRKSHVARQTAGVPLHGIRAAHRAVSEWAAGQAESDAAPWPPIS